MNREKNEGIEKEKNKILNRLLIILLALPLVLTSLCLLVVYVAMPYFLIRFCVIVLFALFLILIIIAYALIGKLKKIEKLN